jgi:1-aminocyclopropane-1-carboxylate deaminase/D-cysteine desulfhydrase-like pyridoxal-dependent ACC family enzyme
MKRDLAPETSGPDTGALILKQSNKPTGRRDEFRQGNHCRCFQAAPASQWLTSGFFIQCHALRLIAGNRRNSNMPQRLSRRSFLKISAAAAVGMATAGSPNPSPANTNGANPLHRATPLDEARLPRYQVEADASPALARRYPWVRFGEKPKGLVQIATGGHPVDDLAGARSIGDLGERIIQAPSGVRVLPWTPMFRRPTRVYQADGALRLAGTGRLFIKDEGSEESLLYGNKIRKYEFLLPNLASSGIRTLRTHGAYGSNHLAYLTLAARYGGYRNAALPNGMDVELMLYPQELSANVITKLKLLVASGAKLNFLAGDTSVGLSILSEELRVKSFAETTTGYVPPGGSSPLAVLGHVEALMELAEQIEKGDGPLATPPDYIFVPLGSGATAMGLVLGCYLLGWPTKVVGTCSQDKGRLARLVVNGEADTPFLVANAASLLEKSLKWVEAMGLSRGAGPLPASRDLLKDHFAYDSETWLPAYGKVTPKIAEEVAMAAAAGLVLDNTFSGKSFHTVQSYAERGLLHNKSALFWNTYHRFHLDSILPKDDNWLSALPEPVSGQVATFMKQEARRTA